MILNNENLIISINEVSDSLLSNLESRDVALWIRGLPKNPPTSDKLVSFLSLPWQLVVSEISDIGLLTEIESQSNTDASMVRKRGFAQIIESDPSRIDLPQRCLPIYLLNGRQGIEASDFENQLRRMTMLEELRRSGIQRILFISGDTAPIPPDFKDIWSSGFRAYLTFVTDCTDAQKNLEDWLKEIDGDITPSLSCLPATEVVTNILERYAASYPEDRHIIRVHDQDGILHKIDITGSDEPERPILESYDLIEDKDLELLVHEELAEDEFIAFFQNPEGSWRPYAAGLPWLRDDEWKKKLERYLKKLDAGGSGGNCIAYILSEPGAGGTTTARALAWELARQGYPVLAAKAMPFIPDALAIGNFLNRVRLTVQEQLEQDAINPDNDQQTNNQERPSPGHYETPWIIVFDRLHWEDRASELRKFYNEIEKQGRPVCILVVSGPMRSLPHYTSVYKEIAELSHSLDQNDAQGLGQHLNQFLRTYGKERQNWQWKQFYEDHTVRYLEGTAAFWVTLSFWIQGQYDLSESIQQWMYREFKENTDNRAIRNAIFEIAALSSERLPLPDGLLSMSEGAWPVSHLLEDSRPNLGALGLVRISTDSQKYWALAHDILGRYLINAFYYDFQMREEYGFSEAKDADHLRFLLLRQISQKRELGERMYRTIGEDFATSVFKIDPDHGRGSFAHLWSEVLEALDAMPHSLKDTSRVFRHHLAVSRRRIAKLNEDFYGVTTEDKVVLLTRALEDINYALKSIDYTPGSEPNINLYNSLARAYLDLADVETIKGEPHERIIELRQLASEATRQAYEENPDNSFVIETYVKNKLGNAQESPELAVEYCIEVLGVLFSIVASNEGEYRRGHLAELADKALDLLFNHLPASQVDAEPATAIDVLLKAWVLLAKDVDCQSGIALSDVPESNRTSALVALEHPAGYGNMQIIRLSYDLMCISQPSAFKQQLELVEQLQATDYRMAPQLRLEYGLLLYQGNRMAEAEKAFRQLRQLWRENEHFVQVPERLRWLRDVNDGTLRTVQAFIGSDYGHRSMARVREFGEQLVPFRPEEFGFRDLRPGQRFACHVSFGHNGPFLRPVTASAKKVL